MAKYVKTEGGYQEITTTVVPVVDQEITTTVVPMVGEKMDKNNPVGTGSFSMGRKSNTVIGSRSHAEGYITTASSNCSHAEGFATTASGYYSHAEGVSTIASGDSSHAEGGSTTASGINSHAEGDGATASGDRSHAEGWSTTASSQNQHVQGKYNIVYSQGKYAHIVGNGTNMSAHSNAHTLDWNGNAWYAGDVYTGSTSGTNRDEGSKKLATEEYVDSKQDTLIQSGAAVGQIAKITAVDDTGKPTAWEAVDMPTGGNSEEMRVIKTITITADDVNSIYFNSDDNGLPFALTKHIRIRMYGAETNTGSTQATLFFRAGQTTGDASQHNYPIKVNSNNTNYLFDFVWDLYSATKCWYGDFANGRAAAQLMYRYAPSNGNNVSDITVSEIKLVWSGTSTFFQKGATIVVEGM